MVFLPGRKKNLVILTSGRGSGLFGNKEESFVLGVFFFLLTINFYITFFSFNFKTITFSKNKFN